ncbi:MAG: acyloxyacyl hydrolase [Gammaproteobacteria bacterium]|nr:acyloxyacyl hydrolase [Gammaproteobacteria bacterium]
MGSTTTRVVLGLLGFLIVVLPAAASPGGVGLNAGGGEDSIDLYRLDLLSPQWQQSWFDEGKWHWRGHWELGLAHWDGDTSQGKRESLSDWSVTPVIRLQPKSGGRWMPYFEAGLGVHLLSHTSVDRRSFGTAFQFGTLIGAGFRCGRDSRFEAGYRYQHISNASIKSPNDGMDFHMIRLAYWLP